MRQRKSELNSRSTQKDDWDREESAWRDEESKVPEIETQWEQEHEAWTAEEARWAQEEIERDQHRKKEARRTEEAEWEQEQAIWKVEENTAWPSEHQQWTDEEALRAEALNAQRREETAQLDEARRTWSERKMDLQSVIDREKDAVDTEYNTWRASYDREVAKNDQQLAQGTNAIRSAGAAAGGENPVLSNVRRQLSLDKDGVLGGENERQQIAILKSSHKAAKTKLDADRKQWDRKRKDQERDHKKRSDDLTLACKNEAREFEQKRQDCDKEERENNKLKAANDKMKLDREKEKLRRRREEQNRSKTIITRQQEEDRWLAEKTAWRNQWLVLDADMLAPTLLMDDELVRRKEVMQQRRKTRKERGREQQQNVRMADKRRRDEDQRRGREERWDSEHAAWDAQQQEWNAYFAEKDAMHKERDEWLDFSNRRSTRNTAGFRPSITSKPSHGASLVTSSRQAVRQSVTSSTAGAGASYTHPSQLASDEIEGRPGGSAASYSANDVDGITAPSADTTQSGREPVHLASQGAAAPEVSVDLSTNHHAPLVQTVASKGSPPGRASNSSIPLPPDEEPSSSSSSATPGVEAGEPSAQISTNPFATGPGNAEAPYELSQSVALEASEKRLPDMFT